MKLKIAYDYENIMKMSFISVVAPCSLVEVFRRFRVLAASIIYLMMEAASTSSYLPP
jgi:hypothetical protein